MVTYSGYTFQVTWKNQLKHHYANPAEYVTFMGYFSSCTVYLRQIYVDIIETVLLAKLMKTSGFYHTILHCQPGIAPGTGAWPCVVN